MSDDLNKKRPQDVTKVNIHEDWEVRYWCNKWNITKKQLEDAVKAVGTSVTSIEKYLKN